MTRATNFLLCFAIVVGLAVFVRRKSELMVLQSEYDRLVGQYGSLDVKDPTKFYVKRLATEHDKDFLWRVYRPDAIATQYSSRWGTGGSSSGSNSKAEGGESLYRCRFVFKGSTVEVHVLRGGGAGRSSMGQGELADFLKEHWDELEIETIEDGEHEADEVLRFVTLRMPATLVAKLTKTEHGRRYKALETTPVYEYRFGSREAFEKAKKQERGEL